MRRSSHIWPARVPLKSVPYSGTIRLPKLGNGVTGCQEPNERLSRELACHEPRHEPRVYHRGVRLWGQLSCLKPRFLLAGMVKPGLGVPATFRGLAGTTSRPFSGESREPLQLSRSRAHSNTPGPWPSATSASPQGERRRASEPLCPVLTQTTPEALRPSHYQQRNF